MIRKPNFRGSSDRSRSSAPRSSQTARPVRTDRIDAAIDSAASGAPQTSKYTQSRTNLRIIPLGGLEEVGANMTVFEYGDDMIIVDMGFSFPDETTPGIDYIIPDTKWLEEHKKKIRGVIITHGHMDHTGAIPYLLPKLGDPPIYTLPLSAGLIKKRLEEFNLVNRTRINAITKDDTLSLGVFKLRFFLVNHNIPDSMGISITTPVGQIIHTGDWKLDHTPVNEKPAELHKMAKFGSEGVMVLMSDSTNAEKPGYSLSEKDLGVTIDRIFQDAPGRVVFASFSSLISRMQQVFDISAKYNRKVLVTGRSMVNNIEIALSLGYLKVQPKQIIKSEQARKFPDNQVTILTTGAQGEEAAGLARMARGEHKTVKIKKGDTVVVSASPIPGNERAIVVVLDNLIREGAHVIYNKVLDVHTSGHASQEELKLMLALTKPKYFIPIHGEHHMLVAHGNIAKTIGLKEENVKVLENGSVFELNSAGEAKVVDGKVQAGYVFVDGLGVGDVGEVVIRDRQVMASDGMFVIIVTLDRKTGKLINQPDIISRGFIFMKNNDELVREVKHEVKKMVEAGAKKRLEPNWSYLRQSIRDEVGEFLFQKTQRRPMILPVVIEI
jgi:ribonuclease J